MLIKTVTFFILYSFGNLSANAISSIDFPKDHHFNCLDIFNNDRCTKSTRIVYVYDSELNRCVPKSWHGCSTENMFYDAENCNNACTLCIRDNGDHAEYMGFKYFNDALSPNNRTDFYQLLNKLESHLRLLSDQDSLIAQRANSEVDGDEDDSDAEPPANVRSNKKDLKKDETEHDNGEHNDENHNENDNEANNDENNRNDNGANNEESNKNENNNDENNKNDDVNENDQEKENQQEDKGDDNQEEDDDNWEDENSEWDNPE